MAINGVASLVYGVDDLAASIKFYKDFGLTLDREGDDGADFHIRDGSTIMLRKRDDPALAPDVSEKPGVRETVWGVDSDENLDALEKELSSDMEVSRDDDGTIHILDPLGIGLGFRVFKRQDIVCEKAPTNTIGNVERWDANRKWYHQAEPKLIHHIGYAVPAKDIDTLSDFYCERLNFRVTDISKGLAVFLLADGRQDHHSIFIANSNLPQLPGEGILWNHASFGVEDIDEMMTGANHMQRKGWESFIGMGRHRISSALNYYIDNPAGGQSEYLTDTDYVTDDWKPRLWNPMFGFYSWTASLPEFLQEVPPQDWSIVEGDVPTFSEVSRPPSAPAE